jgi:hypothetical protein
MFSNWLRGFGVSAVLMSGLLGANVARADLLYSTNFNGPLYTDGPLIGQDGWAITGTTTTNPVAVSNTATNGSVALTTTGQDVNRPFASTTSGSIFLSASITLSAAQATGDYFLHMSDGGTSNFYSRIYARSQDAGFTMAMGTSSGAGVTYGTAVLNFGQTYNILARYDIVSGAANDTGALYINPNDPFGNGDTPYVNATTIGTDAVGFAAVNLRQGTAGNASTLVIDNIAVNTITAVPEPTSLALLAVGGCVGLFAMRRRAVSTRA